MKPLYVFFFSSEVASLYQFGLSGVQLGLYRFEILSSEGILTKDGCYDSC